MEGECLWVENVWRRRIQIFLQLLALPNYSFVSSAFDAFSSSPHSSLLSVIRPASVREAGNNQFSTDPVSRDQAPTKWILLLCKAAAAFSAGFMAARWRAESRERFLLLTKNGDLRGILSLLLNLLAQHRPLQLNYVDQPLVCLPHFRFYVAAERRKTRSKLE